MRTLSAPNGHLLKVQRHICEKFLSPPVLHSSAHGYVKDRSIVSNALPHAGHRCLLKIDLLNFFPSIKFHQVRKLVDVYGDFSGAWTPEVGYFIARLCTLYGALPQGAATSPMISNLLMYPLDKKLAAFCTTVDLTYTRYADDLCFSGEDISKETVKLIHEAIHSTPFTINRRKAKLIRGEKTSKIITGIAITSGMLRVPKSKRRQLRAELNRFQNLHAENVSAGVDYDLKNHASLLGKFQYWRFVEPSNAYANEAVGYLLAIPPQRTPQRAILIQSEIQPVQSANKDENSRLLVALESHPNTKQHLEQLKNIGFGVSRLDDQLVVTLPGGKRTVIRYAYELEQLLSEAKFPTPQTLPAQIPPKQDPQRKVSYTHVSPAVAFENLKNGGWDISFKNGHWEISKDGISFSAQSSDQLFVIADNWEHATREKS
jgi:hypothetical protein